MTQNEQSVNTEPVRKGKQKSAYPLRFRSKAEEERIKKAAKRERKTIREFLLDSAEKAAQELAS